MTDTALLERRARLIENLRNQVVPKATGSLCVLEDEYDEKLDQYVTIGVEGYCCIGVALKTEPTLEISDETLSRDDSDEYDTFRERYRVSEKLKERLVAMNDGDRRTVGPGHYLYTERSHPFIARFLEIVWALEGQENEDG